MNCRRFFSLHRLRVFGLISIVLVINCGNSPLTYTLPKNENIVLKIDGILEAKGNELKIELDATTSNRVTVTITNISDNPVFCSYIPIPNSNEAAYFPFIVERKLSLKDEFKEYISGGHFAPSAQPIARGNFVTSDFPVYEKGWYRIKLGYIVDETVRDLVTEKIPEPGLTESEREMIKRAYGSAISSEIYIKESSNK